ncbi:hypothetical protein [Paenibacillus hamazuiensis]|uniref:hypothetical protein n=1 Tax=Paenibacillus hamazuiensis TaxID=2936508 RepID=UPI00200E3AA7|nr:hypothetical protein [Paenibacillus hamazuiensis]
MLKSRIAKKCISIALALIMIFSLLPGWAADKVQAAGGDLEVTFGAGTRIGNLSYAADNAFINFHQNAPGFTQTETDNDAIYGWADGDILPDGDNGVSVEFRINVKDNPALLDLAQSGHAEVNFGWDKLDYDEFGCVFGICKTRVTSASITVDGQELSDSSHGGDTSHLEKTVRIKKDTVIEISVWIEGSGAGVYGMFIKFQDKERPVMTGYTFTGDGAERLNKKNQQELYVKKNENITLAYNFSEPVKPTQLIPSYSEHFLKHPLFVNPDGTGLPAAGEQQYLINQTYNSNNLNELHNSVVFKYTGSKYHNSGNNPLEPKITGSLSNVDPIDEPLEQKFKEAVFADAAGNVATIQFPGEANSASNDYLDGKTINPFDYEKGGYRVIVDAVPPKYTKVGNGIQPEILTGVTLNNNDSIDFTVQFTEEAIVKTGWDVEKTFLLLNNGMKAYYVPDDTGKTGSGTDKWRFHLDIPDGVDIEAPLLKVIALSHDNVNGADKNVLQDYAGNMLVQPANYDGVFVDPDGGETANVNSKIDWAQLSIDNTKPVISYHFESGGASDTEYKKNGKITIDANDPQLIVPDLDPEDPKATRPSKGIYRPSNMTGTGSPAVGLVYYWWSNKPDDPFATKSGDHFAAVKRYSLAAKQPRDDLYPGEFTNFNFSTANNKTNLIPLPAEALTSDGSGEWYLHTWTADMTWDSARELMQYAKMKNYINEHPAEYKGWKDEASGSEADKEFYANNKALAAVGDYSKLVIWPLTDFKKDDSNWTYNVAKIKVDNKAPDITLKGVIGSDTAVVQVPVSIKDEHSGLETAMYKWVKDKSDPDQVSWNELQLSGESVTLSTENEIVEDGSYWLYVKATDKLGNEQTVKSSSAVVVNSANMIQGKFEPEPEVNKYVKSYDISFKLRDRSGQNFASVSSSTYSSTVTGLTYSPTVTKSTYSATVTQSAYQASAFALLANQINVSYTFSNSIIRPDESAFKPFTSYNESGGERTYTVPADPTLSGEQFIHILVKTISNGVEKKYYFSKAYYFDNEPSKVEFSKSGVSYPQPKQSVTVTVTDAYSGNVKKVYQWVDDTLPAPNESSVGWVDLPEGGKVEIDNKNVPPGAEISYRLYVWTEDNAKNSAIVRTDGIFKVSKPADTPPVEVNSDLVYLYGDSQDGYTAVVNLGFDAKTMDKGGYDYSVSPDNGVSWLKWRPYTNFASLKVPTNKPEDLKIQVKFRTSGGVVGEAKSLDASHLSTDEPIYALATLSTDKPVTPGTGVDIDVWTPVGIKVAPSAGNPDVPVRTGNKFTVRENGLYSFDLTDAADASRTAKLYVVVKNVDRFPPEASYELLTTEPTSGNVTVRLTDFSEPLKITNNNGHATYTFTKNDSFGFDIEDEAGNTNTVTAKVYNIDKQPPRVKVVRSYSYGENNSQTFGTIKDGNGNVLYSSGVTLSVEKEDAQAEDFIAVDGKKVVTLQENGTVSFVVADALGNTTVVSETVNNIISTPPIVDKVVYTFVDEAGNQLPESSIVTIGGQQYARGKVKATLSGKTEAPNMAFAGTTPILNGGVYTNRISDPDGNFSYSRTYSTEGSTLIAVSDLLGNVRKVPVSIKGLDNTAPTITLNAATVAIAQNKADFDFRKDLGGYTVSDNVSAADQIEVSASGLDVSKLGRQRVTYTARDQVGNTTVEYQDVIVVPSDGMQIFADDVLISSSSGETALFNKNTLTFSISQYNVMEVGGQDRINEWGTYDLLYQPGLYREGQMKYIASKITYSDLVNGHYKVTFPEAGWYTIIVRNQEREREYATFFIGGKE